MKIAILSIGNEVLRGSVLNTNAHFLAHLLHSHGYEIAVHLCIADEITTMQEAVDDLLKKVDIIITTGGLGPTCDDLTRLLFEPATYFDNPVGTAKGLAVEKGKGWVFCLPGPPREMMEMAEHQMLPFLKEKLPVVNPFYSKTFSLMMTSELEVDPFLREYAGSAIDVGVYPNYGYLFVSFSAASETLLEEVVSKFRKNFSHLIYSEEEKKIEVALLELMHEKKKSLCLAESCTGGLISSLITKVPGSSHYFLGSVVSYADAIKEKILHTQSLKEHGAVSFEVVKEMAGSALKLFDADYSIAVSGIAGPSGGSLSKPIGTVFGAICSKKETILLTVPVRPYFNREMIQIVSANYLLSQLYSFVKKDGLS